MRLSVSKESQRVLSMIARENWLLKPSICVRKNSFSSCLRRPDCISSIDFENHRRHHETKSLPESYRRVSPAFTVCSQLICPGSWTTHSTRTRARRLYQKPLHEERSHDSHARRHQTIRVHLRA